MTHPLISIVVPTLDEASRIALVLDDLRRVVVPHEVIVVDGGSADETVEIAEGRGARVLRSARGRGVQLGVGARAARAPMLAFLHADVRLPPPATDAIARLAAAEDATPRSFRLRIDGSGLAFRAIEFGANLRAKVLRLPYGDQGLVISRHLYDRAGGYPEQPFMEDVALALSLRRIAPIRLLSEEIRVSARRWERDGPIRRSLRNLALLASYLRGSPIEQLAHRYQPESHSGGDRIALLAKSPQPGRVKTRLVPPLTQQQASAVYEASLRDVLELTRGVPVHTVVYRDDTAGSADHFARIAPRFEVRVQRGTDLGERLANAVEELCGESAQRVCVIGADSPTLPLSFLRAAFPALSTADVVIGPAADGGYYLIGIRCSAWPAARTLFFGIEWSTPTVLSDTLARAEAAGLSVSLLTRWYDIDSPADLHRALRDAAPDSHLSAARSAIRDLDEIGLARGQNERRRPEST